MIIALLLAASSISAENRAIALTASAIHALQPQRPGTCFGYEVEEQSATAFDLDVREVHNSVCGGDPDLMLVTERFRVNKSATSISRYDVVEDRWMPCKVKGQNRPLCP